MPPDYIVPFLLSTVESEPFRFQEAIVVALHDPKSLRDIRSVLAVLRDEKALVDFNRLCPPDMILDIPPWKRAPAPKSMGIESFRKCLTQNGLTFLSLLSSPKADRLVASVCDTNGGVHIAKELWDESSGPLGDRADREDSILDCLHRPYKLLSGKVILRLFERGETLSDIIPSSRFAEEIVRKVAENLRFLHEAGVLYMDLSKSNVLTSGALFDFSHSRRCGLGSTIGTYLVDPVYAAPETFSRREASPASDIWALGVLAHQLFTGDHPFVGKNTKFFGAAREHAVAHIADPYEAKVGIPPTMVSLLRRMMAKDPADRPTADDVVRHFSTTKFYISRTTSCRPKALLPMRCGVPHKGHINLIARVLELGFRPVITLQKSYTWTDQDPLPKWVVAEMLRVALSDVGYPPDSIDILPTPYSDLSTHRMHFLMLPEWENVRIVVSGNPEVRELLSPIMEDREFLTSQSLCGYLIDANGTKLRGYLRDRWFEGIREMLPQSILRAWGVESIVGMFPKGSDTQIDFPVKVKVKIGDKMCSVPQYLWPHEVAFRQGHRTRYLGHEYDVKAKTLIVTCG